MPTLSLRALAAVFGQRGFVVLLVLFFVGLSVQYSHKASLTAPPSFAGSRS